MEGLQAIWLRLKLALSMTKVLLIINVAIFVITLLLTPLFANNHSVVLYIFGAEFVPDILNGQVWRMVLPAFLHANIIHLAFNMWALYNLGGAVEMFYGSKKLFSVYIFSAIFGSAVSVFMSAVGAYYSQDLGSMGISIGASGAVFGLIGLLIGNKFKDNRYSVGVDNYINTSQLWGFVVYNLLLGFGFNFLGSAGGINNWAHVGGFLGGFILGTRLDIINTLNQTVGKKMREEWLFRTSMFILVASIIAHIVWLLN